MLNTTIHRNLENILNKTIVGNVFYLRSNKFHETLYNRYKEEYLEIFKLPDNLRGEFKWEAKKNSFKDINIWNMRNYLKIYNNFNNKIVLNEELVIVKTNLSLRTPPSVFHSILQEDEQIKFTNVNSAIYKNLFLHRQILN